MEKFGSERNTLFSVIFGHTLNVILGFIPRIHTKHTLNVILGFVPRIHTEHFSLLDTRVTPEYDRDLMVDSRDTPENDHNNLRPQCAPDTTGFLSDVYKRGTRARKFLVDGVQCGRSMIEMLGVLAIIGVLSIGGIAGYTKAMEKIHVNKIVNMVSDISATIKTAYISQKTYDNLDGGLAKISVYSHQIQDMGLLPPEYIFELEGEKRIGLSSPLTLINPLGYTEEYEEGGFSALSIGVLVPQNLCVPLLTYDWRNADMKGIVMLETDLDNLGFLALFAYDSMDIDNEYNCSENNNDSYFCIEKGQQRFKPVSPAVAAKYCESSAADTFGTGQMYVGFDLLADIKVPKKD